MNEPWELVVLSAPAEIRKEVIVSASAMSMKHNDPTRDSIILIIILSPIPYIETPNRAAPSEQLTIHISI